MLLVALGGGLGSVARYKLSGWVLAHSTDWKFPLGTFAVNVVGCLIAGLAAGLAERYHVFSPDARLFLFVGILGGFTTFSAFGLETVFLMRRGDTWIAALNIFGSVLCGVVVLWAAIKLVAK
ncbi:MAG TPA: fluoride efflux transporter CrcB [Burkholderiales bacterium]|nr:fluoride efflux transporter CrcB [Burkholderiales bacterium]